MSLQVYLMKKFAPKTYAKKQSTENYVSNWIGRCNLDGQAPMAKEALTNLYTGIQDNEPKKIMKVVEALKQVKLNCKRIEVALVLAESLYLAGCYYPPKAEKTIGRPKEEKPAVQPKKEKRKEPHYFDKAISLCREIIISDASPRAVATAKTILGRILIERHAFDSEAKALLEEAGTPVALFILAQLKQTYVSAGYANYLEAAGLCKKINTESLPKNVQAIIKSNIAVSLFTYSYAKRQDETVYIADYLLEAIKSMKEAVAISNSDYDRIRLGGICSGAVLILKGRRSLSSPESVVLENVQNELDTIERYFTDMRARRTGGVYNLNVRASWPTPGFLKLPENFVIDSIPAKAN